jgi:hypothetical protein
MWRGLASLLAKLAARNKKLTRLYRGTTLYPEKKLISEAGEGIGERAGSWFSKNRHTAESYALRPSKSYQDETGKAFRMGFNPDNPGVIRRVDLDLGPYGNKHRQVLELSGKKTHTPYYNLPEEEASQSIISLIPTLKNIYSHPLFKGPQTRSAFDAPGARIFMNPEKREMIKMILNILKSGEKIRPFNRGGLASFVL